MSLFTRQSAQCIKPAVKPIPPNPRLTQLYRLLFTSLFFGVMYGCVIYLPKIYAAITFGKVGHLWEWLVLPLMYITIVIYSIILIRSLKRFEPLRLAAVQHDERLLATEQPQPTIFAIQPPMKFNTHPMVDRIPVDLVLLVALSLAIFGYLDAFTIYSWIWSLLIAVLAALAVILFALLPFRLVRHPIEVTEADISARGEYNSRVFMRWHEVRLFSCYCEQLPFHNSSTIYYELASSFHVIEWRWTYRKNPLSFLTGPFMPLDEHCAQMQALAAYITAKTGLPLYNLSKDTLTQKQGNSKAE